jgi:hypothetical protein
LKKVLSGARNEKSKLNLFVWAARACVGEVQVRESRPFSLFIIRNSGVLTLLRPAAHTSHAWLNLLKMFALLNVVLSFWQPAFHGLTAPNCSDHLHFALSHAGVTCQSARWLGSCSVKKNVAPPHILLARGKQSASSTLQTEPHAFFEDTPWALSSFHVACHRLASARGQIYLELNA